MKNTLLIILLFTGFTFTACKNSTTPDLITVESNQKSKIEIFPILEKAFVKVTIEGMTCAIGCAAKIEQNLQKTSGVTSVTVNFESKTAWIVYDSHHLNINSIAKVVNQSGEAYDVSEIVGLESFN
jgi:Cu+-exporting ATPase